MTRTLWLLLVIALMQAAPIWAQLPDAAGRLYSTDPAHGQDDLIPAVHRLERYLRLKATKAGDQLDRQTEKVAKRLRKQEARIGKRLRRIDVTMAADFAPDTVQSFFHKEQPLFTEQQQPDMAGLGYLPNLDSLQTALKFLKRQAGLLPAEEGARVVRALRSVETVQEKLKQAERVKVLLRERKEMLRQLLARYDHLPDGIARRYRLFQQELYYYTQAVQHCRETLSEPDKILSQALGMLTQLPAFQRFMAQYSELAGLFSVPAGYGSAALAGLQSRNEVQQRLQTQLALSGPNAQQVLQQQLQAAQAQLNGIKDKINKFGGGASEMNMPSFKPNDQRFKTFWQRLEYSTNIQSQRSTVFFPVTTDVGVSVGYKLNDKSVVGFGGSYKIGWGKDIRHMEVSSQGAGVRSFLDVQLKGSFYAAGGFEYNYQPIAYTRMLTADQRLQAEDWQQSGLLGISKMVSLNNKLFKKTKVQLLWDFLSYRQKPRAQALRFRMGYSF